MEKTIYKSIETKGFKLNYYLLDNINNEGYGIKIDRLMDSEIKDTISINDICVNQNEMSLFLDKIIRNELEPDFLYDVVYDWINERAFV